MAEAIELLQQAIKLAPRQPAGLRNLAWIYATCPDLRFRDGPKAVEFGSAGLRVIGVEECTVSADAGRRLFGGGRHGACHRGTSGGSAVKSRGRGGGQAIGDASAAAGAANGRGASPRGIGHRTSSPVLKHVPGTTSMVGGSRCWILTGKVDRRCHGFRGEDEVFAIEWQPYIRVVREIRGLLTEFHVHY